MCNSFRLKVDGTANRLSARFAAKLPSRSFRKNSRGLIAASGWTRHHGCGRLPARLPDGWLQASDRPVRRPVRPDHLQHAGPHGTPLARPQNRSPPPYASAAAIGLSGDVGALGGWRCPESRVSFNRPTDGVRGRPITRGSIPPLSESSGQRNPPTNPPIPTRVTGFWAWQSSACGGSRRAGNWRSVLRTCGRGFSTSTQAECRASPK